MFKNFFNFSNNLNEIHQTVKNHKKKVENILSEIELGKTYKENYSDVIQEICDFPGIYMWKKDKDFLYKFANIEYCNNFLGLPANQIYGLSDKEIFEKQKDETKGIFLSKMCLLTDNITKKKKKPCTFIEGQFSKGVLRVKKIPIVKNKEYDGVIGVAKEYKNMALVSKFLNIMIEKGNTKILSGNLKTNFCCQIFDQRVNENLFF